MSVTKRITGKRGGANRGQGNKPIDNKRVSISISIPPNMLKEIDALKQTTGDSMSSTIIWLLDIILSILRKFKKI